VELCETLQAYGLPPFAHPFKDSWTVFVDYFADEYVVRSEAPDFYAAIEAGRKKFSDYPHFKALLQRLHKRASYEAGDDWGTDNATAQNMMATGKAAMYIMGSWSVGDFVRDFPNVPIGVFSHPSYEDPAKNLLPIGVDDCWMASSSSDHYQTVLEFFSYITNPSSAVQWMDATKTISLSTNIPSYDYDPISQQIVDLLETGRVTNFHAPVLFSSALEDVYRNMIIEAVASGSEDYDSIIAEFDRRIEAVR
jgi:raffinose/stachyose/melibiose transport system substrate-binding protein